ncbi:MAG: glutathione-disulfide reductase [Bradymonadia bacterium]
MSEQYDFDLFTLGAGSGGVRASRMAAATGARVAVAEGQRLGGTCVNVGCVPKKLMVYASHYHEAFEEAAGFGWTLEGKPTFDWPTLIANKDKEIARLNGIYERILKGAGVQIIHGWAKIIDAHTVEVATDEGPKRYTAKHILVATGGSPSTTSEPGAREHGMVSDDVFTLEQMPERIVIAGGGYIAVEFAGVFNGLGAQVDLIYRGAHLLRGFDDDLRSFVTEEMRKKGINIHFNQIIECVDRTDDGLLCTLSDGDALPADAVLYAIGRKPNVKGLGLEEIGVEMKPNGAIVVNDNYQSSVPSIYALGDVTDRVNLTPVAIEEAMVLVNQLFGDGSRVMDYADIPTAVFTQPPMATVGLTEAQARSALDDVTIYTSEFRPMKHTLSGSTERTFMKLIVDAATDRVVGAHMAGADAPEIIQGVGIALKCGATKAQFDATVGIHPTAAEEFVTMRTPSS